VNTVPAALSITEDQAHVFAGQAFAVSDADGPATLVQVSLSATGGVITLGTPGAVSFTSGDGTEDAAMTFSGTLAALADALEDLVFTPTANFTGAGKITMVANDLGNSGTGGAKSDTDVGERHRLRRE
jgi:hypothetical protein